MDDNKGLASCGCSLIGGVLGLVLLYFVGGVWRTEVSYVPSGAENVVNPVQFEETLNARHWALGFIKGQQPDLQQALSKHLKENKRLTQLSIDTRHSALDYLLMGVTIGVYCPITVTVRGTTGYVPPPAVENVTQPPQQTGRPPANAGKRRAKR